MKRFFKILLQLILLSCLLVFGTATYINYDLNKAAKAKIDEVSSKKQSGVWTDVSQESLLYKTIIVANDPRLLQDKKPSCGLLALWKSMMNNPYKYCSSIVFGAAREINSDSQKRHIGRYLEETFLSKKLSANPELAIDTLVNLTYFKKDVIGYKAASKYYFNKEMDKLEPREAALLAAISFSPSRYDPDKNPENALKQRSFILKKMKEYRLISEEIFEIETSKKLK